MEEPTAAPQREHWSSVESEVEATALKAMMVSVTLGKRGMVVWH
jgi:hypothetical protein